LENNKISLFLTPWVFFGQLINQVLAQESPSILETRMMFYPNGWCLSHFPSDYIATKFVVVYPINLSPKRKGHNKTTFDEIDFKGVFVLC
jgi:hypothetical protein